MKVWKKVCIGVGVVIVAGGIVTYSVKQANKDVVTVQTAKVNQEHLTTIVTASGQIMPKTYSNILAQGFRSGYRYSCQRRRSSEARRDFAAH